MPRQPHHTRREEATENEPAGPGCPEQAERGGGKPFRLPPERQEQRMQSGRGEQDYAARAPQKPGAGGDSKPFSSFTPSG